MCMLSYSAEAVGDLVGSVKDSGCRPVMPSRICTGTILTRTTEFMYVFPKSVRIFIRVMTHLNEICLIQFWLMLENKPDNYEFCKDLSFRIK